MDVNAFDGSKFLGGLYFVKKLTIRTSQGYIEITDDGEGDVKVIGKEYVERGK